jgi:hypothetical protein
MSEDKRIFLYRKSCPLSRNTIHDLRRAGFIPIGVNEMDDAVLLQQGKEPIDGGQIMNAAIRAISAGTYSGGDEVRKVFFKTLIEFLPTPSHGEPKP